MQTEPTVCNILQKYYAVAILLDAMVQSIARGKANTCKKYGQSITNVLKVCKTLQEYYAFAIIMLQSKYCKMY